MAKQSPSQGKRATYQCSFAKALSHRFACRRTFFGAVLSAEDSVKSRASYGGTAPKNVRRQANRWLKALAKEH